MEWIVDPDGIVPAGSLEISKQNGAGCGVEAVPVCPPVVCYGGGNG